MSVFPWLRMRRLRQSEGIRRLVRHTYLQLDDLIYPIFVSEGHNVRNPIPSMPGIYQLSLDRVLEEAEEVVALGIPAILLFGIPETKDEVGSQAYAEQGIVQKAVKEIKGKYPEIVVITDVCLCEYTSHGHCGLVEKGEIKNDETLELLALTALSHAQAGADIVAPSDMMDGRVYAIRQKLDEKGYSHIPIMAYSAKYASCFYGPFRDAAGSAPQFGDRRSYQMDPASSVEQALEEVRLDLAEGADMVIVKPALAYLDVIRRVRDTFAAPVVAYNVSGEYAMVKAAAQNGWLDEKKTVREMMLGMKRAGSDMIITYHAKDIAKWIRDGNF
ncbi:porphobilinogen synthase [Thermanaerosceptrum fracticalcis]|uniref:Delta-aminolevulinic acid dehydratase n=1 Tax=Thermanaerosceptrum fracticalcis TaxID=1712410 RepID=A0A7G6E1D4_THEFR|nr:porphobilinogen synthase [Thermanaerosceptrum fracticalcis]QNB45888.1 porphobilinogen synthase [Thermanaerosceptrum fracticalcis]